MADRMNDPTNDPTSGGNSDETSDSTHLWESPASVEGLWPDSDVVVPSSVVVADPEPIAIEPNAVESIAIDPTVSDPTVTHAAVPDSGAPAAIPSQASYLSDDDRWRPRSENSRSPQSTWTPMRDASNAVSSLGAFDRAVDSPMDSWSPGRLGAGSGSGSAWEPTAAVDPSPTTNTSTASSASEGPRKQSWAKPALVGGIVGALISGAASTGAFIATRQSSTRVASSSATVPVAVGGSTASATLPQVTFADGTRAGNMVKAAYQVVSPSVVSIDTKGIDTSGFRGLQPAEGSGSGIVISEDGLVLTNAHVVRGATSITVRFSDRSEKPAILVGSSTENDVALVRVQDVTGLQAAQLGSSASLEVGDDVVAVGNALALDGGPTVTTGIISALDRDISDQDVSLEGLIQTDAAINPGNSGGPLVNAAGQVVGMNTAIIQNSNNIGFAIAIDRIKPLIDEIKTGTGQFAPKTFLGVSTQTVNAEVQAAYGLVTGTGAIVVGVQPGSPAENAGLESGDVIVKFDGVAVSSSEQLQKAVRDKKPQDKAVIEWQRGDQKRTATVVLGQTRQS